MFTSVPINSVEKQAVSWKPYDLLVHRLQIQDKRNKGSSRDNFSNS